MSQAVRGDFESIYQAKFLGRVEGILRGGVERGELRPVNLHLATWLLLGMAYPFFYPSPPLGTWMRRLISWFQFSSMG